MKALIIGLVLASCGTPTQAQLARTPTATTPARPAVAPAASDSDADREQLIQSNQDMQDARNAHHEALQGSAAPVKPKTTPASPDKPPPKPN